MIILATTLLYHVVSINGVRWDGIGAAWMFSAMLDTLIVCFYIYAKYMFK